MAKLAPRDLAQVLSRLPKQFANSNVLVGYDGADDAGVFKITDDLALVQTVDFFTPLTNEPRDFGRIAAVNALNDVYAMGGKPVSALAVVCYPQKEDLDVLGEILAGGQEVMNAEGVSIIGGHTVDDAEIKFGYSVTGLINPLKIITNSGAQIGDELYLTKPLGTGAISTAIKKELASEESIKAALQTMITTARTASVAMIAAEAHACTDVTGFGLVGHAYEMAKGSGVTLQIDSAKVPLLPDVLELIKKGMLTRGDKNNRAYVGDQLCFGAHVAREMQSALLDPQTAGGLLISVQAERAKVLTDNVWARKIGKVVKRGKCLLEIS